MPFDTPATGDEIRRRILDLLARRAASSTICPSEVARSFSKRAEEWRPLMQPVRDVAATLVEEGEIEVTQKGEVVDLNEAKGPIRLRKVQREGREEGA